MAANVLLLMSLIANAISSGIIFFSGPPIDLAYLQSNTNVSIYDVEQLSSIEEKALGDMNIFLNFNRRFAPKLVRLIGEHQAAIIIKAYQDICDYQMFRTYVNDSDSEIKNQNYKESFIHLNDSAIDTCGRTIGYQTKNNYFEPSILNMLELTRGSLCVSDRYCFGIKRKDNNASNPLIHKSPNCYNICIPACPEGEYLDGCYCFPKYYDWRVHLQSAVNHPGGILFLWFDMFLMWSTFYYIYFFSPVNKIKYLYVFPSLITGFVIATYFTYHATINEYGFTTGHCSYYLVWLHIFNPNVPVNRLLTCHHDAIPKYKRYLIMFFGCAVSGIFILLQLISLNPANPVCFGVNFPLDFGPLSTRLFGLHVGLMYIFTLVCHCIYSRRSSLRENLLDAGQEMLFLIGLNLVFKSLSIAKHSKDSIEVITKTFDFALEMNLSMCNDLDTKKRSKAATFFPAPELVGESQQVSGRKLQSKRRASFTSLPRPQFSMSRTSRGNTI